MKVELSRFRVKSGKSSRVDEWLSMLNANMDEVLQTLEREQMKLEVIFREIVDGEEYLYWLSVQGEAGEPVNTSPFAVDQKHIAFHEECIDHDYGMRDAQPQVIMVPGWIARAMDWTDPPVAAVDFQPRELIYRREQGREGNAAP
jgi:Family of unknown function (DUF6176)